VAFGEEISKILPEMPDPEKALEAFERIWDDLMDLPLVKEEEVDRIVDKGHFVFSTISKPWTLSRAQEEIVFSLSRGETYSSIAKKRGCTTKTVAAQAGRARIRLRTKTNEETIAVAIGSGIISAISRDPILGDRTNIRGLAKRHKDVLRLMALGETNDEIAEQLGVSAEAVKDRVEEIRELMGARNRTHAVALAFMTGRLVLSTSRHQTDRPEHTVEETRLREEQKEGASEGALE